MEQLINSCAAVISANNAPFTRWVHCFTEEQYYLIASQLLSNIESTMQVMHIALGIMFVLTLLSVPFMTQEFEEQLFKNKKSQRYETIAATVFLSFIIYGVVYSFLIIGYRSDAKTLEKAIASQNVVEFVRVYRVGGMEVICKKTEACGNAIFKEKRVKSIDSVLSEHIQSKIKNRL